MAPPPLIGAVALASSLFLAARGASAPGEAQPRFRSAVDLVALAVTAHDSRGNLITDLSRDEFKVVEDGLGQTVQTFAQGLVNDDGLPIHLGLMFDRSASLADNRDLERKAVTKLIGLIPTVEDVTFVEFDSRIQLNRYSKAELPRLFDRIGKVPSGEWTAFYDALAVYLDDSRRFDGRTILVMYTDGADSASRIDLTGITELLRSTTVTAYAIGLIREVGLARKTLQDRIQQITEITGGQAFYPRSLQDLDVAYAQLLAHIKAQYLLGYSSTNATRDGTWRRVEVKVSRPGVRLRFRPGYFARSRPPLHHR